MQMFAEPVLVAKEVVRHKIRLFKSNNKINLYY